MPFKNGSFDIVFNTGVLEHFNREEQILMGEEFLRVIKESGYFITANPSSRGKIYNYGMKIAKEKGIWEFGQENPIKSLDFFRENISGIFSIEELEKDFLSQLSFLRYSKPIYKFITAPIRRIGSIYPISDIFDFLFSNVLGTYLLISIIKKK